MPPLTEPKHRSLDRGPSVRSGGSVAEAQESALPLSEFLDSDAMALSLEEARDDCLESREPFTFHDEVDWKVHVRFEGDDLYSAADIDEQERRREERDREFWERTPLQARLTARDLAAIHDHDARFDCPAWEEDEDDLPSEPALEAVGRTLWQTDAAFWVRLRKLGRRGIPHSLIAEANELLFPGTGDS